MRTPRLDDLDALRTTLWRELARACRDKHHAWRTPALATVGADGAQARTVVLREADDVTQTLFVFSDARARKVAELQAQPHATLLMWSPRLSWQLRLRVQVDVHMDGLAVTSRWARLQHSPAAQDYLAPQPPGSPALASTLASTLAPPTHHAGDQRHHFAVLSARVLAMDWLELHPEGHRRATFDAQGAHWLVP
jgi:pyridoxamine 5'-phosphate oxidase